MKYLLLSALLASSCVTSKNPEQQSFCHQLKKESESRTFKVLCDEDEIRIFYAKRNGT